jgi:LmbE family N-acetylglucosaminyl deacetylase
MHPYRGFVTELARLAVEARALPLGGFAPAPRPTPLPEAGCALVFAPHPDDECLTGGWPLRLLREARMRVVDVAVTLGSAEARRGARLDELRGACAFLGFELMALGLQRITPDSRAHDPDHWQEAVAQVAAIVERERPRIIFCPHPGDRHATHVGTYALVVDALAHRAQKLNCLVALTEYWAALAAPNVMVESNAEDVADLVAAASFHAGEMRRNPYHVGLPAWMQDNVRRGSELLGGAGSAAARFSFATLYRLERWRDGQLEPAFAGTLPLASGDDPVPPLNAAT